MKVVEGVILDLETQAQQTRKMLHLVDGLEGCVVGISAHGGTALKQRCRLVADDVHVDGLVDIAVAGDVNLVNLAKRQVATHVGQGREDARVARGNAAAQGSRDKEVAHEHGHVVAPHAVDGG